MDRTVDEEREGWELTWLAHVKESEDEQTIRQIKARGASYNNFATDIL